VRAQRHESAFAAVAKRRSSEDVVTTYERLGQHQFPVSLGDDLDGAVGHLDR
jgi:hypothetical protein